MLRQAPSLGAESGLFSGFLCYALVFHSQPRHFYVSGVQI
jgi:hypothetical protein